MTRKQAEEYRAHVGPAEEYDLNSAIQFNLLTSLGLRDYHTMLDIGCGSLRGGRLFISYLRPGKYFGLEPLKWLVREGIENEMGESIRNVKQPTFLYDEHFSLSKFDLKFDFILAQSIFSHASQDQMRRCFAEAAKVMKPDSIFVATFFEGEKNYEGKRWVPLATYRFDRIQSLVEEHGMTCKRIDWAHPDSQTWILILHPEGKVAVPEVGDTERLIQLERKLANAESQLAEIRRYLCVRFRTKIAVFRVWFRFKWRELWRRLRKNWRE